MPLVFSRRPVLATVAALSLAFGPALAQDDAPVIAAASDLQFAVEEIAAAFTAETGMEVRLSMGSTGNFARQIREGAPFQIFMAADEQFIFDLARDRFARDEGDLYAIGRIVVKVPPGSTLAADGSLESLRAALAEGRITRFAIANPDHAPYGRRAKEALEHAGLWEDIQPFLVLGENVSQAAQFALSGNADGGIIAYALALAPELRDLGTSDLIPEDFHEPLRQRMALLNGAGPVAEAFYAYMKEPAAREIMERYGFVLPDGA
ncbi:Molybdenum ABC transporter periplasmic molybdate-binding protein [Roseovarius sp. EC-HK134]|uniref:molybdate ABC transporter substrate-binding protein n=1 Tax=unclassified Roseovarius TaxID=2614913 RepID=UPI001258E06B|nr:MULTISPECIES: molybdate ABC transporter substrate-binding protein [unclassified Roseovarius]VVS96822.1 Molybdenum ABC transporter periplasmic molybdate-binding protein [Roseovarius sp. EC-HK134]VVT00042.1 Molybdenum ABC transporter periplasmic molybdate-binding protein [Roseovarius sp. EC-SD190]